MAIGKSGTYALGSTGGATTDSFTPSGSISGSTGGTALTIAQLPAHNHPATSTSSSSSSSSTSDGILTTGSGSGPGGGGANIISGNQSTRPVTGITTSTSTTTSTTTTIGNTGSGATHDHTLSATFSGSAGTVDVLNPYISINFIIKA